MKRFVIRFLLLHEGRICYRRRPNRCGGQPGLRFLDGVDIPIIGTTHQAVYMPPVLGLRGYPAADDVETLDGDGEVALFAAGVSPFRSPS